MDTALYYNRKVAMSQNQEDIGALQIQQSRAPLYPQLTLQAEYKYYTNLPYQLMPQSIFGGPVGEFREVQFGVPHAVGAQVQWAIALYNPQVYGAIKSTQLMGEVYRVQTAATEEQVFFEVANLYYNAQLIGYQLAYTDSNILNANKLLATVELLRRELLATATDVRKVELQIDRLLVQRENLESQRLQIYHQLNYSMGRDYNQPLSVPAAINLPREGEQVNGTATEVKLADLRREMAEQDLDNQKQMRRPTLSAFGAYGASGFGYGGEPDGFLKIYQTGFAGLRFSYPIFDGLAVRKAIERKGLEKDNAALEADLVREQNQMQTGNALLQKAVTQRTVEAAKRQITLARHIYGESLLLQREGLANLTDVLQADAGFREAQQAHIGALVEYLKADLHWRRLNGNLTNPDK